MYWPRLDSKARSRSLHIEQSTAIPSSRRLSPLFEDLLLGAEPVLLVMAKSTATGFIQLIGPLSDPVLGWDSACHLYRHLARRTFRGDGNLWLRSIVTFGINHLGHLLGAAI